MLTLAYKADNKIAAIQRAVETVTLTHNHIEGMPMRTNKWRAHFIKTVELHLIGLKTRTPSPPQLKLGSKSIKTPAPHRMVQLVSIEQREDSRIPQKVLSTLTTSLAVGRCLAL